MPYAQEENPVIKAIEMSMPVATPWMAFAPSLRGGSRKRQGEALQCALSYTGLNLDAANVQLFDNRRTFTVAVTWRGGCRRRLPIET